MSGSVGWSPTEITVFAFVCLFVCLHACLFLFVRRKTLHRRRQKEKKEEKKNRKKKWRTNETELKCKLDQTQWRMRTLIEGNQFQIPSPPWPLDKSQAGVPQFRAQDGGVGLISSTPSPRALTRKLLPADAALRLLAWPVVFQLSFHFRGRAARAEGWVWNSWSAAIACASLVSRLPRWCRSTLLAVWPAVDRSLLLLFLLLFFMRCLRRLRRQFYG